MSGGGARLRRAAPLVAAALAACLPPTAVSRRDEVPADAYSLSVQADVTTSGLPADAPPVAPFTYALRADVRVQWARTFRDGSIGRLVQFDAAEATVARDGGAPVPVPALIVGAWVELRTFDTGEVLSVGPIAPWAGTRGHLEALDVIWPTLSRIPELASSAPGAAARRVGAMPMVLSGGPRVRTTSTTDWTLEQAGVYRNEGYAHTSGGPIDAVAESSARVVVDIAAARLVEHDLTVDRVVRSRWPTGGTVEQAQRIVLSLRWTGARPAIPLAVPADLARGDDPIADAAPLRRADGREAPPDALDVRAALPFLLLPDDLPEETLEALRQSLVGPATLLPQVSPAPP